MHGKSYASGTAEYLELIAHGKFTSASSLHITPGPQTSQASIKKTIPTYARLATPNGATTRGVVQQVSRLPHRRPAAADGSPRSSCVGGQGQFPAGAGS